MKKCSAFDSCNNKVHAKTLCKSHYAQLLRGMELKPLRGYTYNKVQCKFSDCRLLKISNSGYCGGHNAQLTRGQKLAPLKNWETLKERIERKIIKHDSGCLVWTGNLDTAGYPTVKWKNESLLVHRAYYKIMVKDIQRHDSLDHLCRNKLCIEPSHLEPVSLSENVNRMLVAKYYEKEISRLVDFIESLGYDSKTLLPKE